MSPRAWKRIYQLLAIGLTLCGVGAITLMLALPALARWQIRSALAKAGYEDATFVVESATPYGVQIRDLKAGKNGALALGYARLDYAPLRALTGKIDALRLEKVALTLDLDATQTGEAQRHFDLWTTANASGLPLWRIELADLSVTLLRGGRRFTVHTDGWLWRDENDANRARLSLTLRAGEMLKQTGWLEGHVWFAQHKFDASAGVSNINLADLFPFAPEVVTDQIDKISGMVDALATVVLADGMLNTQAAIELRDGSVETTSDLGMSASGATASVKFASLNPLRSEPGQRIDIKRLKLGEGNLVENLHVEFDVDRSGLHPATSESMPVAVPSHVRLSALRLNWAGGDIASDGAVYINPIDKSVSIRLHVTRVGLNEFLRLVTSGKVSGRGSLSGDLPLKIHWPHVEIGTGQISTDGPGDLNFGQQIGELASSVAEKDPRLKDQKQQIMEALAHFHYDQIVFDFQRGETGLQVMTHIGGRGTQGTTTPIDLTVRYAGLEEALNAYLGASLRVNSGGG